eukprot:4479397-Pleurochrysis_carterae.AAC.1
MAAGWPGGVPVVATPWGSDADRQDASIAAKDIPTALATPVPHLYDLPCALAMPLPQTALMLENGSALLDPDNTQYCEEYPYASSARYSSFPT